jgi:ribosomal protein L37AE/L43A
MGCGWVAPEEARCPACGSDRVRIQGLMTDECEACGATWKGPLMNPIVRERAEEARKAKCR